MDSRDRWLTSALLIAAIATGCSSASQQSRARPEPQKAPAEVTPSSRSDRVRAGGPQEPSTAVPTQQQPTPASEPVPPSRSGEPDPRAVIDWLLKDKR